MSPNVSLPQKIFRVYLKSPQSFCTKRDHDSLRESWRKSVADVIQATRQVPFQVPLLCGTKNFQTTHVLLFLVRGQFDFDTGGGGARWYTYSALTKVKSRWNSPLVRCRWVSFPTPSFQIGAKHTCKTRKVAQMWIYLLPSTQSEEACDTPLNILAFQSCHF